MKILLHLLFGYTVLKIKTNELKELFNVANSKNVPILTVKEHGEYTYVRVYSKYSSEFINAEIIKSKGLPWLFKKYAHRLGLFIGLITFFAVLVIAPMFVWEINVEGHERLNYGEVINTLNEAGVKIGSFSPNISRSDVYSKVVLGNKDIAWISVNFSGSRANVEIIEREYTESYKNVFDGANIIALCDGQIIDTDIKSGRRAVKDGDVVKKGDLLVSGIYDSNKYGTRIVYADAKIFARISEEFSTVITLKNTQKKYLEEENYNINIKIFEKSINIFKNYSKSNDSCDTIIREDAFLFGSLSRLPITVEKICALPYVTEEKMLTETEALNIAKNSTANMISNSGFKDIISVSENYYTENGHLYYNCTVDAVKNIACVSEFNID